MFSVREKRQIAERVQDVLRESGHPDLIGLEEIEFVLTVKDAERWSWSRIRNNAAVPNPSRNPHNEAMDPMTAPRVEE